MKPYWINSVISAGTVVYLAVWPVQTLSQDYASGYELEEIIVTATKRETSLQEIPMAVQAVTGEQMANQGIGNLDQLAASTPGLQVGDGLLTTNIAMRGMGSQPERGFEQSVGMFIDGLYMPRSRQYRAPFMDASRVEILRGPQAVLFGLNSTAGAVSVLSNSSEPGAEFEGSLKAGYEFEYRGLNLEAVVGGSPTDALGLRLAAKYRQDDEGFYQNSFNGHDENAPEERVVRTTVVWAPAATTRVSLKVDYADFESDGDLGEELSRPVILDDFGLSNGNTERSLNFRRNMDARGGEFITNAGLAERSTAGVEQASVNVGLTLEREVGEHTLTAVLGYSDLEWDLLADLDFGPDFLFVGAIHEEYQQRSLELRWTSPQTQTVDWILGAYYQDSDLDNTQPNLLGSAYTDAIEPLFADVGLGYPTIGNLITPTALLRGEMATDTEAVSLFAIATWHLSESFRLTGGVRWVDTEIDYQRADSPCNSLAGPALQAAIDADPDSFFCFSGRGFSDSRESDNVMPELALQWDRNENQMFYGKVGQSAKSGGFAFSTNLVIDDAGNPQVEYDDEEATGYELGLKAHYGHWELNVAFYRTEFEDLQVNTFDPATADSFVQNAAEVVTQGVELDGRWAATEWLTLSGAVAYLDAEYEDFDRAPCAVDGSVPASATAGACDASGRETAYAPEWAGFLGADIRWPLSDAVTLAAGVYLSYSDSYLTDSSLAEFLRQDAYTQVDAHIGIERGPWELTLVGNNLTDEEILNNSQVFLANGGYLKAPRTVSLQGVYRFGN